MNPITHLLVSWTFADRLAVDRRERALVAWAGAAPDADGLGLLADVAQNALGRGDGGYELYWSWHHELLHGLPGSLLLAAGAAALATRRRAVLLLGLAATHLHLACDLVGSRGPDPMDLWGIPYLAPFSRALEIEWSGQWPLNAWPNVALTVVLLLHAFYRAVRSGYSPVGLFSRRADAAFVSTVRARYGWLKAKLGSAGGS